LISTTPYSRSRRNTGLAQVVELEYDFRPIRSLDLFHNIANVHLNGAFSKIELISDNFIRLSASQRLHDFDLTIREYAG
jgi:hypothetical protein